jgi:hypothetical protein
MVKILGLALALVALPTLALAETLTDDQVRDRIIQESIASYPGNCPCPYNRASNGSKCGKRSAWSKAGGYAPLCYPDDISKEMVDGYRERHGIDAPG